MIQKGVSTQGDAMAKETCNIGRELDIDAVISITQKFNYVFSIVTLEEISVYYERQKILNIVFL